MVLFRNKKRVIELEQKIANIEIINQNISSTNEYLQDIINKATNNEGINNLILAAEIATEKNKITEEFEQEKAKVEEIRLIIKGLEEKVKESETQYNKILQACKNAEDEYNQIMEIHDVAITNYKTDADSSILVGTEIAEVKTKIKKMVTDKRAVSQSESFEYNGSIAKGKQFLANIAKIMLAAYNAEAENCMLKVKAGSGESARARLERCKERVRKLGAIGSLEITSAYHKIRIQEIDLTIKYLIAKEREKEEERERRIAMREEAKAQAEIERELAKLEKQKTHYETVISKLLEQGKQDEAKEYQEKITDIENSLVDLENRQANIKAGYVYVISNIGSFGENMVKIGITRRLDPMDRVRELSDASVPFNFDVHALFFSEDAVAVETKLHHRFADRRVNIINKRREFFAVTPAEVKEAIKELAGNLLDFTDEPSAEQYRESEVIRKTMYKIGKHHA